MMKKAMKKILCGALCLTACLGSAFSFSACETSKPEVEMEIEFNGNTYTLEYTLYRKIAPATVNHFIALAENGYYDGLCVHNYTSSKMYTGAYKYENDNLVYQKYHWNYYAIFIKIQLILLQILMNLKKNLLYCLLNFQIYW